MIYNYYRLSGNYTFKYEENTDPSIASWPTMLSEFDYEIKHRPGEKMVHIDVTSRTPVEQAKDTMDQVIQNCLEVLVVGTK